jgi:hypothetical protein
MEPVIPNSERLNTAMASIVQRRCADWVSGCSGKR